MKNPKWSVLILLFIFLPVYAHSAGYMDDDKTVSMPVAKENKAGKNSLALPLNTAKPEAEVKADAGEKITDQNQIKAESICIGQDCRKKWPVFKCANFSGRPAGETGDQFCGSTNKTCAAVSIGTGQSFFSECSIAANSVHECRCCWVE